MNYLGHIYFSNNDFELAIANLFGDHVKGTHFDQYSPKIVNGIILHREIDNYIDTHPSVKKILPILRTSLPKVAGIAIDLYFDHLLAKNWKLFHPTPLNDFLQSFYMQIKGNTQIYPDFFLEYLQKMIDYNWMSHYYTKGGLNKMCHGVSQKLSFKNQLVNGLHVYNAHEKLIETAFHEYMSDANEHFSLYFSRNMS
jgi:acyl carrier protein phosphodiesterase